MATQDVHWSGLGTVESYLRIAATSIYLYDCVLTLPAEYRLYRRQKRWRPSIACIYFVLARYSTLLFLCVSQASYFTYNFPTALSTASLIFVFRTCAIWPTRYIAVLVWAAWLQAFIFSAVTCATAIGWALPTTNNCIAGNTSTLRAYTNWLPWIVFDALCAALVAYRLYLDQHGLRWQPFSLHVLKGSLAYLFFATIINIANAVFFSLPASLKLTTTLSSLSAAFISIMTQRLVTSTHEYGGNANPSLPTIVSNPKPAPSGRTPGLVNTVPVLYGDSTLGVRVDTPTSELASPFEEKEQDDMLRQRPARS